MGFSALSLSHTSSSKIKTSLRRMALVIQLRIAPERMIGTHIQQEALAGSERRFQTV